MKIALIFTRRPARPRKPHSRPIDLTGWTTRDWADLPVHHPRED